MPAKLSREEWVRRIEGWFETLPALYNHKFIDDGRILKSAGYCKVRCKTCHQTGELRINSLSLNQVPHFCMCLKITTDQQIRELAKNHLWLDPLFQDSLYNYDSVIFMQCRVCKTQVKAWAHQLKYNAKPSSCPCREKELIEKNQERIKRIHEYGLLVESNMTKELLSWKTASSRKFKCQDCGEIFSSLVRDVLQGKKGCSCSYSGFTRTIYANLCQRSESRVYLAYLSCHCEQPFLKIGITKGKRFYPSNMPYSYAILSESVQAPGNGARTFDLEVVLHREFKKKFGRYTPRMAFGGMTECFNLTNIEDAKLLFGKVVEEHG